MAQLAEQATAALRAAERGSPFEYHEQLGRIVQWDAREKTLHLDEVLPAYVATKRRDRPGWIRSLVEQWSRFTIPSDCGKQWIEEHLCAVARERSLLDWPEPNGRAALEDQVRINLGERHVARLAFQEGPCMCSVLARDLEEWGVSPEDALRFAVRGTLQRAGRPEELPGGAVRIEGGSGLLLAPELLRDMFGFVEVLASTPRGADLLIADREKEESVVGLADATALAFANAALSRYPVIVKHDGESWEPYWPPDCHPASGRIRNLYVRGAALDANRQKPCLDSLHASTGIEIITPLVLVGMDPKVGRIFRTCPWVEGFPHALPEAETVLLVRGKKEAIPVEFSSMLEVLGDKVRIEPLIPRRFRVEEFPTESEIHRMEPA